MNSMKDMDYRLNTLRVCYLIFISVLALYGHIYYTPFSAKWGLATVIMVFCPVALWVLSISIKTKNKIIMTRETIKDRINVMQAYLDGKDVEYYDENSNEWELAINPSWSDKLRYRIKPEAIYRPFKSAQECIEELKKHEPFGWVKHRPNVGDYCSSITSIRCDGVVDFIELRESWLRPNVVFEYYTFLDGTPFGIKVEDKED